jgi:hypothetical protein
VTEPVIGSSGDSGGKAAVAVAAADGIPLFHYTSTLHAWMKEEEEEQKNYCCAAVVASVVPVRAVAAAAVAAEMQAK